MKRLTLHIISPEGEFFNGEVEKVTLPGEKAPFMVLPSHAPIISSLADGNISYTDDHGHEVKLHVAGGFAEVKEDKITVCVE